ncbi:MAG TPA: malto-oligosyltrehalose trehalohydrolase [Burkholderiales bacterium]|nr:malto-oligosyltrehalose trehalohydrolase [Burkholderiales bacterium]
MKRRHAMPFGATVLEEGSVRFRIWAPAARQVELCLEQHGIPEILAVPEAADGWFELETARAHAGSRYRFRIDGHLQIPDPASRYNPDDVHGPSEVVDPLTFDWQDGRWRGRAWEDAVIYELHIGAFTAEGSFSGVKRKLDYLADLGVTALELMPVADFPGTRNWGYDGVLPFAPDSVYGSPEQLKDLVQSAHDRGLMMFLDVVYNHFGPEGNYLHAYAPQFFSDRHFTPWGAAINFDGPGSRVVRDFFIHNALFWLEEYHFDGLRLDAVHAICDDSRPDILVELAEAVHAGPGRQRQVHLVLENDHNASRYLRRAQSGRPRWYCAQWNDDIHHALHIIATGERDGYYVDYADKPLWYLGRCLTQGFAYQGEASVYRGGTARGEPGADLPPAAFISFLQTHDQVGNRALGERISELAPPDALRALMAVLLLAPSPPLLFMGEEFGAATPFLFFCDFHGELAEAVRAGRCREFERFASFRNLRERSKIPDPNALSTFECSRLDWDSAEQPAHREWLQFYRRLLAVRKNSIAPLVSGGREIPATCDLNGGSGLRVTWFLDDGARLALLANLGAETLAGLPAVDATLVYGSHEGLAAGLQRGVLPPWSVAWVLGHGMEKGGA